jgi:hypothetical protein
MKRFLRRIKDALDAGKKLSAILNSAVLIALLLIYLPNYFRLLLIYSYRLLATIEQYLIIFRGKFLKAFDIKLPGEVTEKISVSFWIYALWQKTIFDIVPKPLRRTGLLKIARSKIVVDTVAFYARNLALHCLLPLVFIVPGFVLVAYRVNWIIFALFYAYFIKWCIFNMWYMISGVKKQMLPRKRPVIALRSYSITDFGYSAITDFVTLLLWFSLGYLYLSLSGDLEFVGQTRSLLSNSANAVFSSFAIIIHLDAYGTIEAPGWPAYVFIVIESVCGLAFLMGYFAIFVSLVTPRILGQLPEETGAGGVERFIDEDLPVLRLALAKPFSGAVVPFLKAAFSKDGVAKDSAIARDMLRRFFNYYGDKKKAAKALKEVFSVLKKYPEKYHWLIVVAAIAGEITRDIALKRYTDSP